MNTTTLVREACKVAADIANRPEMAAWKPAILRNITALQAHPTARNAKDLLSGVKLMLELEGITE